MGFLWEPIRNGRISQRRSQGVCLGYPMPRLSGLWAHEGDWGDLMGRVSSTLFWEWPIAEDGATRAAGRVQSRPQTISTPSQPCRNKRTCRISCLEMFICLDITSLPHPLKQHNRAYLEIRKTGKNRCLWGFSSAWKWRRELYNTPKSFLFNNQYQESN